MKNTIACIAAALSAVLLVSCYWVSDLRSGSVRLDLSALSGKGLWDRYARIWLVADDKVYPLGEEKDYVQKLIPGYEEVTVTLEDIPVGPTYRVWLSVVTQEVDGFSTYVWAESVAFPLSAGDEVAVIFTSQELYDSQTMIFSPVIDTDGDLTRMDKGLTDVEVYSETVYATDGAKLYEIFSINASPLVSTLDAPANQKINSVSTGIDDYVSLSLVLDTNTDIIPYNGDGGYNPDITANLDPLSILDSAVGEYAAGKVVLFRKARGWGGTYADYDVPDPSNWKWLNTDSDRVLDLVVSQDGSGFAYIATQIGAFRLSGEYLGRLDLGESPDLENYKSPFKAPARILSLGLISPDGEVLLMGTENGAYEAWTTGGPDVIDVANVVDGTQGYPIRQIATYYWPNYAAYLSDAYLFIWDGSILKKYPLCAGLPGRITGMTWLRTGMTAVSTYLVVSGDEGMSYLFVN